MDNSKKAYLEAQKPELQSGALKFKTDFISKFDIYTAVAQWIKDDSRVLRAVLRGGGGASVALDVLYDCEGLPESQRGGKSMDTIFKPYFKKALGADYLYGWDYADNALLVK